MSAESHTAACRSCGRAPLTTVLDLGRTPLANALLTDEQLGGPEETYPLVLAFCPGCALAQITTCFLPNYIYGAAPGPLTPQVKVIPSFAAAIL